MVRIISTRTVFFQSSDISVPLHGSSILKLNKRQFLWIDLNDNWQTRALAMFKGKSPILDPLILLKKPAFYSYRYCIYKLHLWVNLFSSEASKVEKALHTMPSVSSKPYLCIYIRGFCLRIVRGNTLFWMKDPQNFYVAILFFLKRSAWFPLKTLFWLRLFSVLLKHFDFMVAAN